MYFTTLHLQMVFIEVIVQWHYYKLQLQFQENWSVVARVTPTHLHATLLQSNNSVGKACAARGQGVVVSIEI